MFVHVHMLVCVCARMFIVKSIPNGSGVFSLDEFQTMKLVLYFLVNQCELASGNMAAFV